MAVLLFATMNTTNSALNTSEIKLIYTPNVSIRTAVINRAEFLTENCLGRPMFKTGSVGCHVHNGLFSKHRKMYA